jgi:hypothetical protein
MCIAAMNHQAKNCVVVVVSDHGHSYIHQNDADGRMSIVDRFDLASKLTIEEAAKARQVSPRAVVRDADEYEFQLHANMAMLSVSLRDLPAEVAHRFAA